MHFWTLLSYMLPFFHSVRQYINAYGVGSIGTKHRFFTGFFTLSNDHTPYNGKGKWEKVNVLDLNGAPMDYKAHPCDMGKPFGDFIFVFGKKKLYFVHEKEVKPVKVHGTPASSYLFQGIFNLSAVCTQCCWLWVYGQTEIQSSSLQLFKDASVRNASL